MSRLMLLRHAKSDWSSPGAHDFSRPLNARGNAAARLMGGYIAHHRLVPDRILCSPSTRTRETLDAMALPDVDDIVFDNRLYAAAAETILSVIADKGGSAKKLMVIGHNPGLHEVAKLLIATGDVGLRERLVEKFSTAALAVIDFTAADWSNIHDHSGRLDRYVTPRSIAAATS